MASSALFLLSPHVRQKLLRAGYQGVSDFADVRPLQLSREAGLTTDEALEVLATVRPESAAVAPSPTALDLLERQSGLLPIVTFCQALDDVLGGGVPLGCVTEFCGVPGIGKTQLGMQLALDVQIPALFGGVAGSAIYIDTEGSFMVSRMRDMAEALVRHLHDLGNNPAKPSTPEMRKALEGVSVDGLLRDVMYYRVHDFVEQVALVNVLPSYLSANSERRFRLIVLDSVAFHFRHHFTDMAQRARVLQTLAQKLQALASEFSLAVVVINQVTTKFKAPEEAYLTPALGESWAHAVTHRVMLYSEGGGRLAHLYKSSSQPRRTAPFRITSRGVRDVADRKRKLPEDDPPNPDQSMPCTVPCFFSR